MKERIPEANPDNIHPALRDPQAAYPEISAALKAHVENARVLHGADAAIAAQQGVMTQNSWNLLNTVHQNHVNSVKVQPQNAIGY